MDTICIMCPMGCNIHIEDCNGDIKVTGQTCKRGEVYGKAEYTSPIRMVTSLIPYNGKAISVKTSQPIPKSMIDEVLKEIKHISITSEVHCGDTLQCNILGTGADIVVTSNM